MSAVIALNRRICFQKSVNRPQSAEEKALAFFQRAEQYAIQPQSKGPRHPDDSPIRIQKSHASALAFFQRADLSDALQRIWNSIKHLPINMVLKLLKTVALLSAVILLTHSISLTGFLALAGAIAALLLAAISNVLVWLIYVPLYFVKTPDFSLSIVLAIGLAWLGGISPFFALVFSPLILFGSRLLEHSQWATQSVSTFSHNIASALERADVAAGIRKAAADITGFIGNYFPLR